MVEDEGRKEDRRLLPVGRTVGETRLGSNEAAPGQGSREIKGPKSVGKAKRIQAVSDVVN